MRWGSSLQPYGRGWERLHQNSACGIAGCLAAPVGLWNIIYHLAAKKESPVCLLTKQNSEFSGKTSEEWIISMKGIRQKEQGRSSNWILTSYHQEQKVTSGQSPSVIISKCTLKNSSSQLEFMYLVFTRMPGENYRRRLRSLLLCLCDVF